MSQESERRSIVEAVIFDLDGIIIQSEEIWRDVRERFAQEHDHEWNDDMQRAVMGMGPQEWPVLMKEKLGLDLTAEQIREETLHRILDEYDRHLPVIPGAVDAVNGIATCWPVALASSSDRALIDHVLAELGLTSVFTVTVSSEEVAHGKPDPDVYLAAIEKLRVDPSRAVAIEDSSSGIRSASAAGTTVIAVPNPEFPPDASALRLAALVLPSIDLLTVDAVNDAMSRHSRS